MKLAITFLFFLNMEFYKKYEDRKKGKSKLIKKTKKILRNLRRKSIFRTRN